MPDIFQNAPRTGRANDKQIILGYPSHDVLYRPGEGDLHRLTRKSYAKVILWLPAFRTNKTGSRHDPDGELPLGIPLFADMEQYTALNDRFRSFAEVCDVVCGRASGRENDDERILTYNIGVSTQDISFAAHIYALLKESGDLERLPDIDLQGPTEKFWVWTPHSVCISHERRKDLRLMPA